MNELIKQTFEGQNITFKTIDNVVYVNATEMAKPFGKFVANFLEKDSTKEYLEELNLIIGNPIIKLVDKQAGRYGGTWMHEDVAMEFARWLSPKFAIWCNSKIKELLTTGHSETAPQFNVPTTFAEALRLAAEQQDKIEQLEAETEQQMKIIEDRNKTISNQWDMINRTCDTISEQEDVIQEQSVKLEEQAPKVQYYERAMNADGLYTITQIAKEFGYSAREFNSLLSQMQVQYKVGGQWVLYAKYANKGYTFSKTHVFDNNGILERRMLTYWTERGREFIYGLMNNMEEK